MNILEAEIDYIAARIFRHIAERLDGTIRATIHKEMKLMTDQAMNDLSAATDTILAELATLVGDLKDEAQKLADAIANNSGGANDAAIEAQAKRLNDGAQAAADAVAALQAAPKDTGSTGGTAGVGGNAGGAAPAPLPGTVSVGEKSALAGAAAAVAGGAPDAPDPNTPREVPAVA